MSELLRIPPAKVSVVPLGINLAGYERGNQPSDTFRVGYFARVSPEKGLHVLAEAYTHLRSRTPGVRMRLDAAGYMNGAQAPYLEGITRDLAKAGLAGEFMYHGAVDRDGKLAFLRTLDGLSVPAPSDEPERPFLLEALVEVCRSSAAAAPL